MPQLLDPNFNRAVVLLIHHDATSTFGLVLNRPVDLLAQDLCESLEFEWLGDPTASVSWGGPVEANSGWLLLNDDIAFDPQEHDLSPVSPGLYFAGSLDTLRHVASHPPEDVRIFLGYAGWGPGQLEAELTQGAWLNAPICREVIFDVDSEQMWGHVVRGMGVDPATLIPTQGIH